MDEPVYLRMAPEYRRCAWYVLAATIPFTAGVLWALQFAPKHKPAGEILVLLTIIVSPFVLGALVYIRWCLRMDQQGIARRFLMGWGDLWTWDDFANGRIEKRYRYILFDPARPWWLRKLSLSYMTSADLDRIMQRINACYRLPDPPPLPDRLELKYAFRRRVALDGKGIHLQGPGELREYLWSDVQRLHITRIEPLRRDFAKLELVLPDREITFALMSSQYGVSTTWQGATVEIVNEFLLRYVPVERVEVDFVGERPVRRSDVQKQLVDKRKRLLAVRLCLAICGPLLVACLVWMAVVEKRVLKAVVVGGLYTITFAAVFWALLRGGRDRCRELEGQLASFDGPNGPAANRQDVSGDGETGGPS